MITRRSVVLAGGVGLLGAHRFSHGQPAATIRRVGLLSFSSEAAGAAQRATKKIPIVIAGVSNAAVAG